MQSIKKEISLSRQLAKRLLPLSLGIWFLISIGFPSIYYGLEYRNLNRTARIYAGELSGELKGIIIDAPLLWEYRTTKYQKIIQDFLPQKGIAGITVLDEKGQPVSSYEHQETGWDLFPEDEAGSPADLRPGKGLFFLKPPGGSAPILFNNRQIGTVYVAVSQRQLLRVTFAIFFFFTSLGAVFAAVVYFFPVRVVKGMEERIRDLIGRIERSNTESNHLRILAETSEQRFRDLVEGLEAIVWEADPHDLKFSFVSRKAEKILGYPAEAWLEGRGFLEGHMHPEDRERSLALYKSITGEGGAMEMEYRFISRTGEPVWIRDTAHIAMGENGGGQLRGLMVDITRQKEMEQALAAQKERLSITLGNIGDGVITTDSAGRVILMNEVACQLTGWTQEESIGRHLKEIFIVLDEMAQNGNANGFNGLLAGLRSPRDEVLSSRSGSARLIEKTTTPICGPDGKYSGMVLVFRDVTEKRKTEEEMQKIEKLESIGILAGGIAHDFNNILTSIIGNISMARMYTGENTVLKRLDEAYKASQRAKDLTTQLLTFSKGGTPVKKITSLKEILRESAGFALRGSAVNYRFIVQEDLWPMEVDAGQINQVFNNILINAQQAMPNGGVIEIKARNLIVMKTGELPIAPGEYVKISIRDQGTGIPPEHLAKIFDPYFTTKQAGSGLGLATSYSIIKKHGGFIRAESKLGKGSAFHVYLPALKDVLPEEAEEQKELFRATGRVLVMDDEDYIRDLASEMLQEIGFEPDMARDGEEAVGLYRKGLEAGQPYDAVLLDLTVRGGMGGTDCMRKLLELDPNVRGIVSSGYSEDPVMSSYRDFGFSGVITKPYVIQDLSRILLSIIQK